MSTQPVVAIKNKNDYHVADMSLAEAETYAHLRETLAPRVEAYAEEQDGEADPQREGRIRCCGFHRPGGHE